MIKTGVVEAHWSEGWGVAWSGSTTRRGSTGRRGGEWSGVGPTGRCWLPMPSVCHEVCVMICWLLPQGHMADLRALGRLLLLRLLPCLLGWLLCRCRWRGRRCGLLCLLPVLAACSMAGTRSQFDGVKLSPERAAASHTTTCPIPTPCTPSHHVPCYTVPLNTVPI